MLIGTYYWDIPTSLPTLNATSFYYVAFVFICFCFARLFKSIIRPYVLLIANIVFLYSFGLDYLIIASVLGVITYLGGILIKKINFKYLVYIIIGLMSCYLLSFKYSFNESVVMPLGLSFYTFKNISYLIDVNNGKIDVEYNPVYYLDYALFFPTIVAGPINRYEPFKKELNNKVAFDYKDSKNGGIQLLLGIFEKVVLCDYVALIVNSLLDNPEVVGMNAFFGILLYSFNIYLDFDSYSNIAIGTSRLFGIHLEKNFNSPYMAKNIKEFWSRWHISLTTWLKDYIYIPLGGNKKGTIRKYINVIIVFFVSGMWHGNTINFIIWGLLHGVLRIIEEPIEKWISRFEFNKWQTILVDVIKIVINFIIVSYLWLIFKYGSMEEVGLILDRIFISGPLDLSLIGLTSMQIIWLKVVLIVTIVLDILRDRFDMLNVLANQFILFRWCFYILLIFVFLIFGVYGGSFNPSDFIYKMF